MKKVLILSITLAIMVFVGAVFSGCTLVTKNTAKYMNTIVAETKLQDKNIELQITKEELIRYCNNYYQTFTETYGYTSEKAIQACLDLAIDQGLLVESIKKDGITLTQNDKNEITKSCFEYVDEQLDEYIAKVKNDWGITVEEVAEQEEEKTFATKEIFEATYQVITDQGVVKIKNVVAPKSQVQEPAISNKYQSYFWQESEKSQKGFTSVGDLKSKITEYSNGVSEEAMKRLVKNIKTNLSYKFNGNETSYEIFMTDYNRVYALYEKNRYIEKVEELFDENVSFDAQKVIEYYQHNYKAQQEKYDDESKIYKAYNEAMKSDASSVYYHPTNSWFYVQHILIGYSDEQTEQISNLKTQYEKGIISKEVYDQAIEDMKDEVVGQARDSEGKLVGAKLSATQIYNEISSTLAKYGSDAQARINAFDDLIYKYSTDEGSFNNDFDYAIPLDSTYDSMVTEFAEASRELYNAGVVGAISGIVMSEYGAHIVIYTGVPQNANTDIDNLKLSDLQNTKLRMSSEKTWFDLICEKVTKTEFSEYQQDYLNTIKQNAKTTYYVSRYKDLK